MYLDIFLRLYIWAAERGVNSERTTNFEKHTKIQNRSVETKSEASFTKLTDIYAKQTITDAKPTVINATQMACRGIRRNPSLRNRTNDIFFQGRGSKGYLGEGGQRHIFSNFTMFILEI